MDSYIDAVQEALDAKAVEMGFTNIFTAVTYADEPAVPAFQEDGKKLRAWRSLVWEYTYTKLAEVKTGVTPIPSIEDVLDGMPKISN